MSAKCELDFRTFQRGIAAKLAYTKTAEVDVINRAARDVCLKSIKYTPRAAPKLGGALLSDGFLMRLVYTIYHPFGGQKKAKQTVAGLATSSRGVGSIRVPGYTRAQMRELANRLLANKRRSRGYIAAGWIKAAQVFGAASRSRVSPKGNAGKGYASKATRTRIEAAGANLATGADIVGRAALQKALDEVGKDMLGYAQKKITAIWNM